MKSETKMDDEAHLKKMQDYMDKALAAYSGSQDRDLGIYLGIIRRMLTQIIEEKWTNPS